MSKTTKNTFTKSERLCSRKQIEILFDNGKSANSYPIKVVYMTMSEAVDFPVQSMFVVPKRNFKRSPDRNKLKRRMREAYRLNKSEFYGRLDQQEKKIRAAFIYTGKKLESYTTVQSAIQKILMNLSSGG